MKEMLFAALAFAVLVWACGIDKADDAFDRCARAGGR